METTVGWEATYGEIHSRLVDHRPVIESETHYFVKELKENYGLGEM